MESLLRDLRFTLRQLWGSKIFTAAAVLSLALGIGVNTAIFSFVNALFLRPLPVEEPGELVALYATDPTVPGLLPLSYLNFEDLEERLAGTFEGVAAYRNVDLSLASDGPPEQLPAELVSGDYFPLLRVELAVGRAFGPETDDAPGAHPVAVLSHDLWQRRFGGDPGAVGRTLRLNRQPYTVVGVASPGFRGVNTLSVPDLWVPMGMRDQLVTGPVAQFFGLRRGLMLQAFGRLEPGVGEARAEQEVEAAARDLARAFPDANEGRGMAVVPLEEARINPNRRQMFSLAGKALLTVTILVLLIACANVANLLMARAAGRRKELAVRLSLGAGRWRMVRQFLVEGVVLALLGGAAGLVVGVFTRNLLWAYRPQMLPAGIDVGLDATVLLFTLGAALLTGVLFAVAPALKSVRTDLVTHLKEDAGPGGGGGGRRFAASDALIVLQVAFSLVALVGTGLFLRSLDTMLTLDPGFETRRMALVGFDLGAQGYEAERARDFQRRAVAAAEALPGVESAVMAERSMMDAGGVQRRVLVEGRGQEESDATVVRTNAIGPGYFATVGIPLAAGRPLEERDREDAPPVAVVNATLAERFWPGEAALGKRIRFVGGEEPIEVVGVAADAKYVSPAEDPTPMLYLPLEQAFSPAGTLFVRTAGDPEPLLPQLRRELQALDPELPLVGLTGIGDHLRRVPSGLRMAVVFLGTFAVLALLLSALGIFGVMEYSVSRRHRELTIRFALGAERRDILGLVVKRAMLVVGVGLVAGVACAALFAGWVRRFLVGSSPADPVSFGLAVAVFVAVALAASLLPGRRAAGTDPAAVLRTRS